MPDYIECKQKETKMGIEDPGTIRRYNNTLLKCQVCLLWNKLKIPFHTHTLLTI